MAETFKRVFLDDAADEPAAAEAVAAAAAAAALPSRDASTAALGCGAEAFSSAQKEVRAEMDAMGTRIWQLAWHGNRPNVAGARGDGCDGHPHMATSLAWQLAQRGRCLRRWMRWTATWRERYRGMIVMSSASTRA